MEKRLGDKIRSFVDNIDGHSTTPELIGCEHVQSFDVTVIGEDAKKYTVTIINHDEKDHM